jgi:D-alanyl-D-alanine carboxypeptidase/D-alanyl-D-alanine-endopeptidase (penicillin-binding protein 4)
LGRDLKSIAKWTNTKSVNLFAEQLICWVAFEKTGYADTKTATGYMERYWTSKINTRGLNLKDGSGLSRNNAINAENFCSLLNFMYRSPSFSDFYSTLPIAGESGTISSLCFNQAGHGRIRAKSGTMNKIKSYAGYVETSTGKKLSFSIMVNNYSCSNDAIVTKIEEFLNVLAVY